MRLKAPRMRLSDDNSRNTKIKKIHPLQSTHEVQPADLAQIVQHDKIYVTMFLK